MTKKIYIKLLVVFQVVVLGFILIGCNKNEEENKESIIINKGAFVDEGNDYGTFNINDEGKYELIDTEGKIINNYNLSSNTYTFFKDNSFYVNYNSEDIKIEHDNILGLKILYYKRNLIFNKLLSTHHLLSFEAIFLPANSTSIRLFLYISTNTNKSTNRFYREHQTRVR